MKKIDEIQYDSLPNLSKDFVNEMQLRSMSAMGAIRVFSMFKEKTMIDLPHEYKLIPDIAFSFAISQIASLIDGRGNLSLKVSRNHQGEYLVDKNRLKKLLPSLKDDEFSRIYVKLSGLFKKNEKLVERIFYTRHTRIAHASVSSYKSDKLILTHRHFPKKQLFKFIDQFESIAYQIIFGIELP